MKYEFNLKLNLQWVGDTWKNCGNTPGQADALAADQAFRKMILGEYGTVFAKNQNLMDNLTGGLDEVIGKGPDQQGFSPAELAAKNSQAVNAAAGAAKHLQTVIGENAAVRGSAVPGVESGATEQELAAANTAVEQNLTNQEQNITAQNYETGRQNYFNAGRELEAAPGAFENPSSESAGQVLNAENITGNQANENAKTSFGNELLGLGAGLAGDVATAYGKNG